MLWKLSEADNSAPILFVSGDQLWTAWRPIGEQGGGGKVLHYTLVWAFAGTIVRTSTTDDIVKHISPRALVNALSGNNQ